MDSLLIMPIDQIISNTLVIIRLRSIAANCGQKGKMKIMLKLTHSIHSTQYKGDYNRISHKQFSTLEEVEHALDENVFEEC
mmetsp:Transcript_27845/g.57289  ORF Transcript_27845/g.57289 Transcript_27845/m.57289 type:complete len:81 (-) Transcript_27845:74-316(-)